MKFPIIKGSGVIFCEIHLDAQVEAVGQVDRTFKMSKPGFKIPAQRPWANRIEDAKEVLNVSSTVVGVDSLDALERRLDLGQFRQGRSGVAVGLDLGQPAQAECK